MRNTIGSKRGSVRGAPPGIYYPFSNYVRESEEADYFKPVLRFFGQLIQIAIAFILVVFCLFIWYAIDE